MKFNNWIALAVLATGPLLAQNRPVTDENAARMAAGVLPIYRVSVTERSIEAINYQHRSGATKIDFRGTELMPSARGEAKVESKRGYIEIEVEFDDMQAANRQGPEYLTYVLWAVTPQGRASNLGEILVRGTGGSLNVTTDLQVFGLIVTAEPYFSVTRPSDLIVMENVVRPDTKGKIEVIQAKYELLQRGQYKRLANPLALSLDPKVPLELYEARNAIQIARGMGADRFAAETFAKAEKSLAAAEAYQARNAGDKPVTMTAREAVQTAEDARAIAVQRQEEMALAVERQQGLDRTAAMDAARQTALAEAEQAKRGAAQLTSEYNAQAAAAKAEAAAAKVEADRLQAENASRVLAAQGEADRLKRENDWRLAVAQAQTERLKVDNAARLAAAQEAEQQNAELKAKLEAEKASLRSELLQQFNAVLKTRDTARGLIVNMPDVLFDTGKFALRPSAREKLAKVVGILSSHPGLQLEVEGHTDSVGGLEFNQILSERRGASVRDYLAQGGLAGTIITSKGFGETQPVATNESASGRQENRRVEIVISGERIGGNGSASPANSQLLSQPKP